MRLGFLDKLDDFGNEMVVLSALKLHHYQTILRVFELITLVSLNCCDKCSRRITAGNILIVFGC